MYTIHTDMYNLQQKTIKSSGMRIDKNTAKVKLVAVSWWTKLSYYSDINTWLGWKLLKLLGGITKELNRGNAKCDGIN